MSKNKFERIFNEIDTLKRQQYILFVLVGITIIQTSDINIIDIIKTVVQL